MHPRNQAIARRGYQELSLIQWTMLIEPIHLAIPSITVLGYQGNHCTCIWLFGTPRFLAAKCQIQRVSPVLNVEAREFQPKIENYGLRCSGGRFIQCGLIIKPLFSSSGTGTEGMIHLSFPFLQNLLHTGTNRRKSKIHTTIPLHLRSCS